MYRAGNTRPIDSRHVPQGAGGQSWRNRGAGLPRRLRARRADGRGVPVRGSQRRPSHQGRRGVPDRRAGAPGPGVPRHRGDHPRRADVRRRRDLPRLRLPQREPRSGPRLRRRGHHVHRSACRCPPTCRQQGAGSGCRQGRRDPHPEVHPTVVRSRHPAGRRGGDRLPGLRQGGRRRRRPRHAPGELGRGAAGVPERGHARGRGCLRRSDRVHRAGGGPAAAHRGTDPGRHPGQRHAPVRAGLLHPAPAPEGGGDRSGPQHHRGTARGVVRRRHGLRAFAQLFMCRHGGVPGGDRGRTGRPARVHRDEPADPGRAHRHRGDHRRRSGAVPDADRLRRVAGRPRPVPGHGADQRRGPAVPDHHGGPGQRFPSRHRHHHRLPHRRRSRRPAGRRHRRHRRRGQCPFRLDARQADLPGSNLPAGRAAGPARPGGVPDPRREHQHSLPAGGAGGPGLHRRRRLDRLHRAAPRAAHHPRARRSRHPAAALAGRSDGQQAVRGAADPARPG